MQRFATRLLLIVLLFVGNNAIARQKKPYNILVLLTDDQRYNTIRSLGNPDVHTPNMDKLVKSYAMISEVDHQIGRVLEALRKSGQYENTVIVLAGDNGLAVGQHGLLGKQNLYDHSMRVPLIFSGPGIPANRQSSAYCYLNDVFPILCELTGFPAPATVTDRSLQQAFGRQRFSGREQLFMTYSNLQRALVKDSMKLVIYNVNGQHSVQLFNLAKDPFEKENLANRKEYQPKVMAMRNLLYAEMRSYGDFCDPAKKDWGYPGKLKWEDALRINP